MSEFNPTVKLFARGSEDSPLKIVSRKKTKKVSFRYEGHRATGDEALLPSVGYGYGSKLSHQRTAGFSPRFHLPGFHLG